MKVKCKKANATKKNEMPFCRIYAYIPLTVVVSILLSSFLEKTQHCLSYPIYEPLNIIHTHTHAIVMFVLTLCSSVF